MSETKLIERLRAWRDVAEYADDGWDMPPSGCDFLSRLCTNAADEIERLRAEVERLRLGITSCLEWANGRQGEWGERAENAFAFLEAAISGTDATGGQS